MADFSTTARPYARAAFELARDGGDYKAWGDALNAIAQLVSAPEVAGLVGNPALTRGDLANSLVAALSGKLPAGPLNLLRLLVENGRVPAASAVAAQFEALRAEAEKRIEVEITSAATVDAPQQQALAAAIRQRLAREVDVSWKTDAALLGGAVIRAGDLVIDGSLSGELERLQTALSR
jgi:F-type H+-transporting ATPase subunit delta